MFFCKKDCLCKLLESYEGQDISIRTKSGDIIEGELENVNCCAVQILEEDLISPFLERRITVVRCEAIESFSVILP